MTGPAALTARRLLACAASVVLSIGMWRSLDLGPSGGWRLSVLKGALAALPLIAGALIWGGRVVAQILARACWWCFLITGTFITTSSGAEEAHGGAFSALCAATALLAVGRSGLGGDADSRFQPVAFRGTLILALVLAMADAVALTWLGSLGLADRSQLLLVLGALMWVGVVGLVRLRTWGLLVALVANVLVATLALTGALPTSHLLQKLFACTAILQLVVPLPMLVTIVRRRAPGPDRWQAARWKAATLAIVVFAAFSVYAAFIDRAAFMK